MTARQLAAIAALTVLIALAMAWSCEAPWASPGPPAPRPASDPAAYQVAEVIEEARRITREAMP